MGLIGRGQRYAWRHALLPRAWFPQNIRYPNPPRDPVGAELEAVRQQLEGAVAALELIADPLGWPPSLRNKEYVVHMRNLAADAIRRGAVSR